MDHEDHDGHYKGLEASRHTELSNHLHVFPHGSTRRVHRHLLRTSCRRKSDCLQGLERRGLEDGYKKLVYRCSNTCFAIRMRDLTEWIDLWHFLRLWIA